MRVLPVAVRPQIGLAYLLARTTDTIADTELVSVQARLEALAALRGRILGETSGVLVFVKLTPDCALPAEKALLERVEETLRLLAELPDADRKLVREVLRIITSGQELDLKRFAEAKAQAIVALATEDETDDYTYRVAGCVGEFWTRICRLMFSRGAVGRGFSAAQWGSFWQGLAMGEHPADLRGICARAGVTCRARRWRQPGSSRSICLTPGTRPASGHCIINGSMGPRPTWPPAGNTPMPCRPASSASVWPARGRFSLAPEHWATCGGAIFLTQAAALKSAGPKSMR